jgi:hypothetical protein
MFKELYDTTIALILKPAEAWKRLCENRMEGDEKFLSGYVYPFIGLIAVAAFLGIFFTQREFDLQIALKSAILALLSSFGGFFLSAYFISELWRSLFKREKNIRLCRKFTGYSSSLIFTLQIVLSLLPEFFFLRFLSLYTIYIVWEGAVPYMSVNEAEQLKFVSLATAIILFTPYILEFMLGLWMPGLKY